MDLHTTKDPLSYNWQAEFRSLHLWTHPALESYRWMFWLDADVFPTRTFQRDPVAMMIQHNLAIFFDHFPGGRNTGKDFDERFIESFGRQVCDISMKRGTLHAQMRDSCGRSPRIRQIHGFFHITDLDFYRSEPVQKWLRVLIGNETRFRRRYDDQIAVTVPAAVLAGRRSWEMEYHGFRPEVYHNHFLDGKSRFYPKGFTNFWPVNGSTSFPEAYGKCNITAQG
jgi:hypothetical protein